MASPRVITAAEILAERAQLRKELGSIPHGTGRGWSSMFWVYCDCPNCRDEYDPSGEESAKYLNMDPASFYTDQSDQPSFAFSKIAGESFLAAATPGFYFDSDARVRTLESFLEQLAPPLALYPKHILHIGPDRTWTRFFLKGDQWVRRTWKNGHSVWHAEGTNPPIPFETSNEALRQRLKELFA
jgi:hypothetical protein